MILTVGQEQSPLSGINIEAQLQAMTFATNSSDHLVSGDKEKVGMWRVEDGEEMATMGAGYVLCLAVSKDGSWIAAGTAWGDVIVWNAKTYKKVFSLHDYVVGLDFSSTLNRRRHRVTAPQPLGMSQPKNERSVRSTMRIR